MIKNGEKILVTLPDSLAPVEGTVTMVHPDEETVSALVDGRVIGVVFAEDGVPRQVFVKRGIRHVTYRSIHVSWVSKARDAIGHLYHDVVRVLSGGGA